MAILRAIVLGFLLMCAAVAAFGQSLNLPIKSSANKRYLVDQNNVPWIMVGDSAHRGICNLPQSAWQAYLQDRANQGFNTIHWFLVDAASPCASSAAAADGTLPFTTGTGPSTFDLSTPNNAYWNENDSLITQAAALGLVVAINPAAWGNGMAIMYQNNGATKVFNFGAYLGNRYKNFTNIVWSTGQDFFTPSSSDVNLMAQLMAGIASTDPNHLDMFQAAPGSFSQQFNSQNATFAANLTMDFVYTYNEVYDEVLQGYNYNGTAPTVLPLVMGESNYEAGNNTGSLSSPANAFITRQEMWYAMTSGATGHIFGNEHVNHFDSSYQANLDTTATAQIKYGASLLRGYPWWTFAPDQTHVLVTAGFGTYNASNQNMYNATFAPTTWDGAHYSVTYTPVSTTLTVNMAKFTASPVTAKWYDPTTGTFTAIVGSPFTNTGTQTFTTPTGTHSDGTGTNDWVLVMASVGCFGASPFWTTTPDSASVQSCVNSASSNDTITVLGGSATYASTVTISKGLTIRIASRQVATLTSSSSSSPAFFTINGTGNNFVHISGDNGSGDCSASTANCGLVLVRQNDSGFNSSSVAIVGPVTQFRLDHILGNAGDSFLYSNNSSAATGPALGVVDHSYLENYARAYFARDQRSTDSASNCPLASGSNGGTAWSEFIGHENTYDGSSKEIYWENDTFNWTVAPAFPGQGAFYSQYGGKVVVRFSTFTGWSPYVTNEGDNPACGSIYYEIYNNTFTENCSLTGFGCEGKLLDMRSGQSLIHDNTFTSTSTPLTFINYPNGHSNLGHDILNSFFWNNTWNGTSCQSDSNPSGAVCVTVDGTSQSPVPTRNTNYFLRAPTQSSDVYFGYTTYTYPYPIPPSSSPSVGLSPTSVAFGNQLIHVTSSSQSVTLTNTSTVTLTISSITLTGTNPSDYAIASNTCGVSLGAGLNCFVGVTFTPAVVGSRVANLTFTTNASTSPDNVPLSGTGTSPIVSLSPSSLAFGGINLSTSSAARVITLTNTGTATLSIVSISVTGVNAGDYATTTTCSASLAINASCTVSVTFTPTSPIVRSASVTFTTNAQTSPDNVSLTGTGITSAVIGNGSITGNGAVTVHP